MTEEDNLSFATIWIDFGHIMLSEIIQAEKDKYYIITHIYGI